MQHLLITYGEGEFASTATTIFFSLLAAVSLCILLVAYANSTYPKNQP